MQGGGGGGGGMGGGGGSGGGMAGGGGGGDACTVFVGNLAWGTTDEDLLATFQVRDRALPGDCARERLLLRTPQSSGAPCGPADASRSDELFGSLNTRDRSCPCLTVLLMLVLGIEHSVSGRR